MSLSQQPCTIGLDLGTTNAKAVAFDASGRPIARAEEPLPLLHDAGGSATQDPHTVYDAAMRVLSAAVADAARHGGTVTHVGLSTAMHSLIPVAADGTPLENALTWADTRARAQAYALRASPDSAALYERTGTPVAAMSPLVKLLWMRAQQPEVFTTAARFVSLKEWLWHRWFGEWAVDASIASATGLYNLRTRDWDPAALALAAIDPQRLSRLVPTTYSRSAAGSAALAAAGLPPDAQLTIGASDGVLANLGAGAVGGDRMALTIGTSLAVRMGTPKPVSDPATQLFCYVLDPRRFIAGGASNNGGIVLDWLARRVLGAPADPAAFSTLLAGAGQAQASNLICLPYVDGERAPIWQAGATAVFFGLSLEDDAATLLRAAAEGILLNARWIAAGLFARLGTPRQITGTGGVFATPWIRQLAADIFGLPLAYSGTADASALGAAALANLAGGVWSEEQALALPEAAAPATVTEPNGDTSRYQDRFARFQALAQALTMQPELAALYLHQ